MKFNRLVFSHILTAMRTDEIPLAYAPNAHRIPGFGIYNVRLGKISAAAFAFFIRFVSALLAYMDFASPDEMHFPRHELMTPTAFVHGFTCIISIRLSVCQRR